MILFSDFSQLIFNIFFSFLFPFSPPASPLRDVPTVESFGIMVAWVSLLRLSEPLTPMTRVHVPPLCATCHSPHRCCCDPDTAATVQRPPPLPHCCCPDAIAAAALLPTLLLLPDAATIPAIAAAALMPLPLPHCHCCPNATTPLSLLPQYRCLDATTIALLLLLLPQPLKGQGMSWPSPRTV
jgi:hypothetical protein